MGARATLGRQVFDLPGRQVFGSEPLGYRMRAEFKVWHLGDRWVTQTATRTLEGVSRTLSARRSRHAPCPAVLSSALPPVRVAACPPVTACHPNPPSPPVTPRHSASPPVVAPNADRVSICNVNLQCKVIVRRKVSLQCNVCLQCHVSRQCKVR